jgi:hypothetical protein
LWLPGAVSSCGFSRSLIWRAISPEAAPGEAGHALGDSDMHAVDGPQVEVGAQSPEDAIGQVAAGLKRGRAAWRGGAGHRASPW